MSIQHPILYTFLRCPYAMRARMALAAAEIVVETCEVVLKNKPAHLLEISPKGTVPVLLLADGSVIEQSMDIMRWALAQRDPASWLLQSTEADALVEINDIRFKPALDRFKYHEKHPEQTLNDHQKKVQGFLDAWEMKLAQTPYLDGQSMRLVDVALFPFVRQCSKVTAKELDPRWFEGCYPRLFKWLECIAGQEAFKKAMAKTA